MEDGQDPETSQPFGDRVDRIFDVHLSRNIPSRNEALITFVDGRPYARTRTVVDYRLDQDEDLVALVGRPARTTDRGTVETPAGRVDYLAVPLRAGERVPGVFVTAIFRDRAQAAAHRAAARRRRRRPGRPARRLRPGLAPVGGRPRPGPPRHPDRPCHQRHRPPAAHRRRRAGRDRRAGRHLQRDARPARRVLHDPAAVPRRRRATSCGRPITIVRGHLELLGDDPQEKEETVELVLDELSRMSRIVDDLLLLAKAEQPDFLEPEPVDLDVLTGELVAKTRLRSATATGSSRAVATGCVVADRQRLTQAVVQLAQNAVQHTEDGTRSPSGPRRQDGELRLWVRDTGPGIAADEQDRDLRPVRAGPNAATATATGPASAWRSSGRSPRPTAARSQLRSRPGAGALFTLAAQPTEQPRAGRTSAA